MRFTSSHRIGAGLDIGGANVPERFECSFEFEEDHGFHLVIAFDAKGRPACEEIRIVRNPDRPPLSGTELRRLPLAKWVTYACTQVGMVRHPNGGWAMSDADRAAEQIESAVTRRTRRRTMTDELLIEVASIADEFGEDAAAIIEDRYDCSIATAYRWLKKAREDGFYTPTEGQ